MSLSNGPWTPANTDTMRIADIVVARLEVTDIELALDSDDMRRLSDGVRRIDARVQPLHYVFTKCGHHRERARLDHPPPYAWHDASPPPAEALMRARTISFRPRLALNAHQLNDLARFRCAWAAYISASETAAAPQP